MNPKPKYETILFFKAPNIWLKFYISNQGLIAKNKIIGNILESD